MGNQEMIN